MNHYVTSLVLACLLVFSMPVSGMMPVVSTPSPAGDATSQPIVRTEAVSERSGFNSDTASNQNGTNSSQLPPPAPSSRPSLFDIEEAGANDSTLPPAKYNQRTTSNEAYNQSNSSSAQTVVYNGTDQLLRPSNGSKANGTQTTNSTQSTSTLHQPSSPPTNRSLRPTINDGIIGTDDRVSVADAYNTTEYPWSSIVRLSLIYPDGTRGGCSGAVISGPDNRPSAHVLTAAHCVYSSDRGGWVDITGQTESYVSPGADGSREPFGRVGIQNIRSYSRWTENENPAYDLALITLDERIGHQTGALGYVGVDRRTTDIYTHTPTRVTGYPGDKEPGTLWTATGSGEGTYNFASAGTAPEDIVHRYMVDTTGGMSGGPTWVEDYPAHDARPVVSVHAYAVDTDRDGETDITQGTRLTRDRFNDIQSWITEDSDTIPTNDRFEPNDDFGSATPVSTNKSITDLQIVNGEFDIFAINVSAGDRITASSSFNHSQGNLNMGIYAPTQEPITASISDTDGEQIRHNASENGTYYVAVYGVGEATAGYSMSLNTSTSINPDTTFSATRSINSPIVPPGHSTTVVVDTTTTATGLRLQENFTPQFGNVSVVGARNATELQANNAGVTASWSTATNVSLVYEVTVPETVTPQTTYNISGEAYKPGLDSVTVDGESTIQVASNCQYPAYSRTDCTIGAAGLLNAAADFRAGTIEAPTLFDIAAAFRSDVQLQKI